MKKYLVLLMFTTLVFTACSTKEPEPVDSNEVIEETMETKEAEPEAKEEEMAEEAEPDVKEEEMVEEAEAMEEETKEEDKEVIDEETVASGLLELTLDELKQYDGTNGNPAYIAVDGKIYDVSVIPNWSGGSHNGFKAGNDLTEEMKEISPHGVSKLQFVDEVGIIVE